jgi:hypothetical protein
MEPEISSEKNTWPEAFTHILTMRNAQDARSAQTYGSLKKLKSVSCVLMVLSPKTVSGEVVTK